MQKYYGFLSKKVNTNHLCKSKQSLGGLCVYGKPKDAEWSPCQVKYILCFIKS